MDFTCAIFILIRFEILQIKLTEGLVTYVCPLYKNYVNWSTAERNHWTIQFYPSKFIGPGSRQLCKTADSIYFHQ